MTFSEGLASLKDSKRNVFLFVIGLILLLLLAAIAGIALAAVLIQNYERHALPDPTVVVPPSAIQPPVAVSKLAGDEAILKKRDELIELLGEIETTDYFETAIAPPAVNPNIKIE